MDHPAHHSGPRALRVLWSLPILGAAACGSATSPELTPARIALDGFSEPLPVGGTAHLTAAVENAKGGAIQAPEVHWTSRDTTTAVVDGGGLVTGIDTGEAWIVARSAGVADSVLADVRFPLRPGEIHVRLRGDEALAMGAASRGFSVFVDRLGGEVGDFHVIRMDGYSSERHVGMSLGLYGPGRFPEGSTSIGDTRVDVLNASPDQLAQPLAFLSLDRLLDFTAALEVILFGPPSRADITYLSTPPGAGTLKGELVGRVVAEGVGYDRVPGSGATGFTPNGRHYQVVADFELPYGHAAVGTTRGTATVNGAPLAWDDAFTRYVPLGGGHAGLEIDPQDLTVQVVWPTSEGRTTGTWTLRDTAQVDTAAAALAWYQGDPPAIAPSASGTLQVDRYSQGSESLSGEIAGSVDAVFYEPGAPDTLTATYDFVAPVGASGPSFAPAGAPAAEAAPWTPARLLGPILTPATPRPPRTTMPGGRAPFPPAGVRPTPAPRDPGR